RRSGGMWTPASLFFPTPPIRGFQAVSLNGGRLVIGGGATAASGGIEVFAPKGPGLAFEQALALGPATSFGPVSVAMDGRTIAAGLPVEETFVLTLQSSDGDACPSPVPCASEHCVDGVCCGMPSCPGEGPCNAAEHCQPGTGTCSVTPVHEGLPCWSDACTSDATC